MESFADHPKSIGELRSDRTDRCTDWTPRDALIDVLRQLDAGAIKPDALIVCWRETVDGNEKAHCRLAAPSILLGLGLLAHTSIRLVE